MSCSLNFLDDLKQKFIDQGNSEADANNMVEALKIASSDPRSFRKHVASEKLKETWTSENKADLQGLMNKVLKSKDGTLLFDSLNEEESQSLKYLLTKKMAKDNDQAPVVRPSNADVRIQAEQELETEIERLQEIGDDRGAARNQQALSHLQQIRKNNSRLGNQYESISESIDSRDRLREQLVLLDVWLRNVDDGNKKAEARIKEMNEQLKTIKDDKYNQAKADKKTYEKQIKKLKSELKSIKNKKSEPANKIKREIKEKEGKLKEAVAIIQKADREAGPLEKKINRIIEAARELSDKNPEVKKLRKAHSAAEKKLKDVMAELNKAGFASDGFLQSIVQGINTAVTARQLAEDLQRARQDEALRIELIDSYFDKNHKNYIKPKEEKETTLSRDILSEILGPSFVVSRTEYGQVLTREEIDVLLKEWRSLNYKYAGEHGLLIADLTFADQQSLEAMQEQSTNEGKSVDETDNNTIIIPMLTQAQAMEKSNPGVIPDANAQLTPQELKQRLLKFVRKLETLRSSVGYGKYVGLQHVEAVLNNMPGLDDVSAQIWFDDAVRVLNEEGIETLTHTERQETLRHILRLTGMTDAEISSLPEMIDYGRWLQDLDVHDKENPMPLNQVVSFDIETRGKNNEEIIGWSIKRIDGTIINSRTIGEAMTKEEAQEMLALLNDLQNDGYKVVTFNGNSFDMNTLGALAENQQMGVRIAYRSLDVMQILRTFKSQIHTEDDAQSLYFSLNNVSRALGMGGKFGTVGPEGSVLRNLGKWYYLVHKKATTGEDVTFADIVKNGETMAEEDAQSILDEINGMSSEEAASYLDQYLDADAMLPAQILYGNGAQDGLFNMMGRNVKIKSANKGEATVEIAAPTPTWALTSNVTEAKQDRWHGLEWARHVADIGEVMTSAFSSIDDTSIVSVDLDLAISRVYDAVIRAQHLDPSQRLLAERMVDLAKETLSKEQLLEKEKINIIQANRQALENIHKEEFETGENAGRYPIEFVGANKIRYTSGAIDAQKAEYTDSVVNGFITFIGKRKAVDLDIIAKDIGFRERAVNEGDKKFAEQIINYFITRFTPHQKFQLSDWGDGTIDYAPANSVGIAIAQIVTTQPEGARLRDNARDWMEGGAEEFSESAKSEDEAYKRETTFHPPIFDEVHQALPRSLAEVEWAYDDWRLRKRLEHILDPKHITTKEEALEVIQSLRDREENENDVIGDTRTPRMGLTPNVSNRLIWNKLPSLEEHTNMVLESMLDMPQILMTWVHDSVALGGDHQMFLDPDLAETYFEDNALSPGSMTGSALISGLGIQLAHTRAYPVISIDTVIQSLERGISAYGDHGTDVFAKGNYFDYKFNGLHHFLALMLQYSPQGAQKLDEFLAEWEPTAFLYKTSKEAQDIYDTAEELIFESLTNHIKNTQEGPKRSELQKLLNFMESDPSIRDAMKKIVIPRLYMGGIDAMKSGLKEKAREEGWDINTDLLAELAMGPIQATKLRVVDKALGGLTDSDRRQLADALVTMYGDIYDHGRWHEQYKDYVKENHSLMEGKEFALSDLQFAIQKRIEFMVEILTPKTANDGLKLRERKGKMLTLIQERFQGRIQKAIDFVNEKGGVIKNQEDMRQLHVIISGSESAWKTSGTLAAMNVMGRTGYRLRSGEKINETDTLLEAQRQIIGRHLTEEDLLNYPSHLVYFAVGQDSAGQRLYYHSNNWGVQPQNVPAAQVYRENTHKGEDDNPYGMWKMEHNNLASLSKEDAETEVMKLVARDLSVRMAGSHAPQFGGYSTRPLKVTKDNVKTPGDETREGFWRDLKKRSTEEDNAYVRALNEEANWISAEERMKAGVSMEGDAALIDKLKQRRKTTGLRRNATRNVLDPTRTLNRAQNEIYVPSQDASVKGLGAFRPQYADIPWAERGIMSMAEARSNFKIDRGYNGRIHKDALSKTPESIADVIPSSARGWQGKYQGSDAPYVHETPIDFIGEGILGAGRKRIARRAEGLKNVLEKFAVEKGLQHFSEKNDWTSLYVRWQVDKKITRPFLKEISALETSTGATRGSSRQQALLARANMLSSLTGLHQFHRDVSQQNMTLIEYGQMLGFHPEDLKKSAANPEEGNQAFYWADFFKLLANRGVTNLAPLTINIDANSLSPVNLTAEGNILMGGEMTATSKQTRIITLTVQHNEMSQVLFTLFYEQRGREIAQEYLQSKMSEAAYGRLKKDGAGFPMLSEVPMSFQTELMHRLIEDKELLSIAIDNMGLHIILDSYTNEALASIGPHNLDPDKTLRPGMLTGGLHNFAVNENAGMYGITPEIANSMLSSLRNTVVNNTAELVSITGSQMGQVESPSMRLRDQAKRDFYESQRDGFSDEMDALSYLHITNNVDPPKSVRNPKLKNEYGQPVVVYDAPHYFAKKDKTTGLNPVEEGFAGYIRSAALNARALGLETEGKLLAQILNPKSTLFRTKYLREAVVIIVEASGSKMDSLFKLEAFLPGNWTRADIEVLYNEATKVRKGSKMSIVDAYRIAASRTMERNTFISPARRYVELNGEIDELNISADFAAYIGADVSNPETLLQARAAARIANNSLKEVSSEVEAFSGMDDDISLMEISDPEGFWHKYGNEGSSITAQISSMVGENLITPETAAFLRQMMGVVLSHNNDFANGLSLIHDPEISRASIAEKYGDKYSIRINPDLIKRMPQAEIIKVFAHEVVHIARMKYMESGDRAWNSLVGVYSTENGRETMRGLITIMTNGDSNAVNDAMEYYTGNIDEFLAEWGAYYLMAKTLGNHTVVNEVQNLRNTDTTAEETMQWWDRAFNYIKRVMGSIHQKLSIMQQTNPEVYKEMSTIVDGLFNFDNAHELTGRPLAKNPNMRMGVAKHTRMGPDFGRPSDENSRINSLAEVISREKNLRNTGAESDTNHPRHEEWLAATETIRAEGLLDHDILGIPHSEYISTLHEMWDADTGEFKQPENDKEEMIMISYLLKQVARQRGERVDSPGTFGHLLRKVFPEFTETVQDFLYNNSNRTDKTWNSKVAIIANLAWLLDNTKATTENAFQAEGNGIIHNKNYIEQYSRRVTEASNLIRSTYDKSTAMGIEQTAFSLLMDPEYVLPTTLTEEQKQHATMLSDIFRANHGQLLNMAKDMLLRREGRETHSSNLALRLNRDFLLRQEGRREEFVTALANKQSRKLQASLIPAGTIDSTLVYMSGLVPRVITNPDGNSVHPEFINELVKYTREDAPGALKAQLKILDRLALEQFQKSNKDLDSELLANEFDPEGENHYHNMAIYYQRAVVKLLKDTTNKKITYNELFDKGRLSQGERGAIFNYLQNRTNVVEDGGGTLDAVGRASDLKSGLGDIFRLRQDISSDIDVWAGVSPDAARMKTAYLLAQVGNSTFIPYEDGTELTITDIFGPDQYGDEREHSIVQAGFTRDLRQIIRGTQRGLGAAAHTRKVIKELTGVNMDFKRIIGSLRRYLDESPYATHISESVDFNGLDKSTGDQKAFIQRGLAHLERVYEVGMNIGNRVEITDRAAWDTLAKFGPDILTYVWGPNLNAANLIFEGGLSGLTTAMYGGNPVQLYSDILGNTFSLIWKLRKGMSNLEFTGQLRALGDAMFDTDSALRDFMENDVFENDQFFEEEGIPLNERGRKAYSGWIKGLRTYNNISAMAVKMATMKQGHRILMKNQEKLREMIEWNNNYDGPDNMNKFHKMKKELGLRFRGEVAQMFMESGLLKEDSADKLDWIMANVPMVRGMIDMSSLRERIEQSPNATITQGNSEFALKDLWEFATSIELFADKYSQLSVVKSDPLDKDVDSNAAWYLNALYRQFPNLFVAQHILRKGARHGMGPYAMTLSAGVVLDLIYNLFLAALFGMIEPKDFSRWAKGDFDTSDLLLIGRSIARFPGFGIRGNAATEAAMGLGYGIAKYTGGDMDLARAGTLAMPLPVVAGIRWIENMWAGVNNPLKYALADSSADKEYWQEKTIRDYVMAAKSMIPGLNDSILTSVMNNAWGEPVKPGKKQRTGTPYPVNAPTIKTIEDELNNNSVEGLYRRAFTEMNPELPSIMHQRGRRTAAMKEAVSNSLPAMAPQIPSKASSPQPTLPPSGDPKAPQTQPPAPSGQVTGRSEGDAATNPIQAPEGLI